MVQMNPRIKEQLKNLKKIKYGEIKDTSAGVVELRICDLSPKDLARCLAVSVATCTDMLQNQKAIKTLINKLISDVKIIFDDDKTTAEEKVKSLRSVLIEGDLEVEHPLEPPSETDKE